MKILICALMLTTGCVSTSPYAKQVEELERIQREQNKQLDELEVRAKLLAHECSK